MYVGQRFPLLVMCATFVASGCVMAALGPALPELARQTEHTLAEVGSIFTALFGAGLIAQVIGGPISDRFGRRVVLVVSAALFGTATIVLSLSVHLPLMLVASGVLGFGYAGTTLSVNVLASELTPHRRAATLNLVNVFYAIGAIAGPLVAGRSIVWWGTTRPALWAGAVLMLLVAPAALAAMPALHAHASGSAPESDSESASAPASGAAAESGSAVASAASTAAATSAAATRASHIASMLPAPFIWSAGILIFFYVGGEAALGGWAPTYLARSLTVDAARAATITSMFWLSLCIGRLLGTVGGLHLTAEKLLLVSILGAMAGGLVLVLGHGWLWITVIALMLLGACFGPIYPTMAAIVTARAPRMAGTAMSRIGVAASIGGMVLPWLEGLLITRVGTIAAAAMTLVGTLGMMVMWLRLQRLER